MAHIRIDNEYTRCPEFNIFSITPAYGIWTFLSGQIIRYTEGAPGANRIFYIYFMGQKWLCSSYSIENIAIYFNKFSKNGKPDKSWVSRHTRVMEKMGLLEKIKDGRRIIYKLGYYTGTKGKPDYEEVLFFDRYFKPKAIKEKDKRRNKRNEQRNQTKSSDWGVRISKINDNTVSEKQLELSQL